ncbi:PilZ domain-containing protein [Sorangium sp. So ce291]|uniref:PilZ domain-containing protein n=1 Tax=Sorangium sp. So ce291 TaxID=3133294 RepID=UPI003F644782
MDMLIASERRATRRAAIVECQAVRERGFRLLGTRAIDLSIEGMLVLTSARPLTGEPVIVSFRIPDTDVWIDATATIARTVHGRREGDPGRAVGLRFDPLDSATIRRMRAALERFPPTYPYRAPRLDYAATAAMIALS